MKKLPIKNKASGYFDVPLLLATLSLIILGIIMVYSASCYNAKINYGNEYYYMFKQIVGAIMGIIAMITLSFIDYHALGKIRYVILGIGFALLVAVFIPNVGVESYGAKRWINLPFFTIQASEIAKFSFIIFTAYYMAKHHKSMASIKGILPILAVGGITCVLIILEPNMSITVCVGLLMMSMLFIGGAKIKHFIVLAIPVIILIPILIIAEPYRLKRLVAFIDPWQNPLGEGYQLIQSYYALSGGGLFGLGLFNSRQKYLFLPFAESDFIFSVIGEELGLIGCAVTILLYITVVFRAIKVAKNSTDRFGCYLASGVACLIAIQVLINIAVVTGSIPPTGLPLPFISSGSSSLIVFCASIGVVESVAIRSHGSSRFFARRKFNFSVHKRVKATARKQEDRCDDGNSGVGDKKKSVIS